MVQNTEKEKGGTPLKVLDVASKPNHSIASGFYVKLCKMFSDVKCFFFALVI